MFSSGFEGVSSHNILVLGLRRVRVLRELDPAHRYREARAEICEDVSPPQKAAARSALQRQLREAFMKVVPMLPEAQDQLDNLLSGDVALGVLTDIIGYVLDLELPVKEALLSQVDVLRRAELLLEHLSASPEPERAEELLFPPQFSAN